MEKISGIYCIENLVNGKKYIGQSKDIYHRKLGHLRQLNRNSHYNKYLQRSWNEHGEKNFLFSVIETCDNSLLNEKEIYYIALYKTNVFDCGYNLNDGGSGNIGYIITEENKRRISEMQMGRHLTLSWKQHISESHKKGIAEKLWEPNTQNLINYNERHKVPINCYNNKGDLICTYDSIHDAARDLNLEATNISKCLVGKFKTCGGYVFCYLNDHYMKNEIVNSFIMESNCSKEVIQVDRIGNILNKFPSIKNCFDSQMYYEKYDTVKSQCRGLVKSKIDYIYIYKHLYDPQKLNKYFKD